MGFDFGNALASVQRESGPNTLACLQRLGRALGSNGATLSTLVRNNESTSELVAGAGLTGGGPFNSVTSATINVGPGYGILVSADSVAVDTGVIAELSDLVGLVSGSGTTDRYPIFTDGPNGVIGDGSIFNTVGGVTVDGASLKVDYGSGTQLRLQNSTGNVLDFSVDNTGAAIIDAAGTQASVTIQDRFTVTNDAATTMAIRRTAGGGTDGMAIVAGATGTTFTVTAGTGPRTGMVFTNSASWATGKIVDFQNNGSSVYFVDAATGSNCFGVTAAGGNCLAEFGNSTTTVNNDFNVLLNAGSKWGNSVGAPILQYATAVAAIYCGPSDNATATASQLICGAFENRSVANRTHTAVVGLVVNPLATFAGSTAAAHGDITGIMIRDPATSMNQTGTNFWGIYIEGLTGATPTVTNAQSIFLEENTQAGATVKNSIFLANATSGYKAIAIRDQNAWIGSNAAATLTLGGTNCMIIATNFGAYGVAAVARPSAYTQTYATATKTHANLTSATLTDSSGGTANTTVQALTDPADTPITPDALRDDLVANLIPELRNNFADLAAQHNALLADMTNLKGVVNSVIDDHQALGWLQ